MTRVWQYSRGLSADIAGLRGLSTGANGTRIAASRRHRKAYATCLDRSIGTGCLDCSRRGGKCDDRVMIDIVPSTADAFRLMRALVDGVFTMADMCAMAGDLGAGSRPSDAMLRCYDLPGGGVLQIAADDAQGELVGAVIVTLCGWDPDVTADLAADPERAAYDRHYDEALTMATATIGMPRYSGADATGYPFRWSAWVGRTGIMALQQSHYDYCPDINLWARPGTWTYPGVGSFVEWLMTDA